MPLLPETIAPRRKYLKKGARFSDYLRDPAAQQARINLTKIIIENCVLTSADFDAAGRAHETDRPFEISVDVSDYGRRAVLTQRERRGGTPKLIGVVVRSFTAAQIKWAAFERECLAARKAFSVWNLTAEVL